MRATALLRSASVFRGGWSLEAAEEICDFDLDTLASLLDKSLVRRRPVESGTIRLLSIARAAGFDGLLTTANHRKPRGQPALGVVKDCSASTGAWSGDGAGYSRGRGVSGWRVG